MTFSGLLSTGRIALAFLIAIAAAAMMSFTPNGSAVVLLAFAVAVATDVAGSTLSRGRETLSESVLDSLADKALVYVVLLPFTMSGFPPLPLVLLLVIRDAIAVAARLVAARRGTVLHAGRLGRLKTATLYVGCGAALTLAWLQSGSPLVPSALAVAAGDLGTILFYLALFGLPIVAGTLLSFVTLFRYIATVRSMPR